MNQIYICRKPVSCTESNLFFLEMGTQALWCMQHLPECIVTRYNGTDSLSYTVTSVEEFDYDDRSPSSESPHKTVPIGPDFQAELPNLISPDRKDSNELVDEPDDLRWICERVWPRQEDDDLIIFEEMSRDRSSLSCSCATEGTIECVRLHIEEKRKYLQKELGDAFFLWGFDKMGEIVGEHWNDEDQHAFHDLVRRDPISFWHKVFDVFPSKTMADLVSYYFNVFVLQRRAVQNRTDPENIDSDDDEMIQENDERSTDHSGESDEEDKESQIESQVDDAIDEDDEEDECVSWAVKNIANNEEEILDSSLFTVNATGPEEILPKSSLRDICIHEHLKLGVNTSSHGGSGQMIKSWEMSSGEQTNHEWIKEPWNSPTTQDDVDKLISTNGLIEEIFGAEVWEGRK